MTIVKVSQAFSLLLLFLSALSNSGVAQQWAECTPVSDEIDSDIPIVTSRGNKFCVAATASFGTQAHWRIDAIGAGVELLSDKPAAIPGAAEGGKSLQILEFDAEDVGVWQINLSYVRREILIHHSTLQVHVNP